MKPSYQAMLPTAVGMVGWVGLSLEPPTGSCRLEEGFQTGAHQPWLPAQPKGDQRMAATSVSITRQSPSYIFASLADTSGLLSGSPSPWSMSFSPWYFCAGFWVESVYKPFKSKFIFSLSSIVFLDIIPIGFQSQVF